MPANPASDTAKSVSQIPAVSPVFGALVRFCVAAIRITAAAIITVSAAVFVIIIIFLITAGGILCHRKAGACGAIRPDKFKGMTALGQGLQVICLKGDDRGTFCYCVIRCIDNGSVYLYPLELSKFTVTPVPFSVFASSLPIISLSA